MRSLYIAGHTGFIGSALLKHFGGRPGLTLITATRQELDLTRTEAVEGFLKRRRPDALILAAGRVGGIGANIRRPADFLYENLMIETNLIHGAWKAGVKRLLHFGSSCMYPKLCPQPMRPEFLMTGPMEPTSESFATAKWAGLNLCASYNRQHGTRFITAIPATVYGPGDSFDQESAHVLPALLAKFHEARERKRPEVILWGSGQAKREFLFVEDFAAACELVLEKYRGEAPINIGSGESVTILELADRIAAVSGFQGRIRWDSSSPDGTPEKQLDSTPLLQMGWAPRVDLREGLKRTYQWFLEQYDPSVRAELVEARSIHPSTEPAPDSIGGSG